MSLQMGAFSQGQPSDELEHCAMTEALPTLYRDGSLSPLQGVCFASVLPGSLSGEFFVKPSHTCR